MLPYVRTIEVSTFPATNPTRVMCRVASSHDSRGVCGVGVRQAGAAGVVVIDEDPVWQKPVNLEEEEDNDSPDEEIEMKRMKRRSYGEPISKDEFLKLNNKEKKPKDDKNLEWGKGLVQKREAEAWLQELEIEKDKPFARSRDDPELNSTMKNRLRWCKSQ